MSPQFGPFEEKPDNLRFSLNPRSLVSSPLPDLNKEGGLS